MSAQTYTVTTGTSDVNVSWRKIQGKVAEGAQFFSEEWGWYDDYPIEAIDWSLRETTIPIDLTEEIGVAFIPEGGKLAKPSSVNMTDLTVPLAQMNARFTASKLAKYAARGQSNQVEDQLKRQAAKKVQAMARKFSIHTHGTSVGTLALTDTNIANAASQDDVALYDGFGVSTIDNAAYLAGLFRVNERIAVIDGSPAATAANDTFGYVDTVDATNGDINITYDTSPVANTNNGLKIVGAASIGGTTNAHTDYNKAINGWADFVTASTLHGIATSSYAAWAANTTSSTGRITPDLIQKAEDVIGNTGGGKVNALMASQGVRRDIVKQEYQLVRRSSADAMEMDGSVKFGGIPIKTSRFVPPQTFRAYDKRSIRKIALLPKPEKSGGLSWSDGKELIDDDGFVFEVNMVVGLFCTNRGNLYEFTGCTES